jgi:hypothetical protein
LNTGNTQKSAETKEAKDFRVLTQAMGSSLLRQKKINGSKFGEENPTTTVGQSPITLSTSFMPFPFSEHLQFCLQEEILNTTERIFAL